MLNRAAEKKVRKPCFNLAFRTSLDRLLLLGTMLLVVESDINRKQPFSLTRGPAL